MLTLKTEHSYSWPVEVKIPSDGGTFAKATFNGTFKVIPQDRMDTILAGRNVDTELLRDVVIGWDGVQDEDGNPIPFGDAALSRALSVPYVRTGLVEAYLESLSGARRKN